MRVLRLLVFCSFVVLLFGVSVFGQTVRASQKGTVSQLIANTKVEVVYSRPVARGRVLFGPKGIVKFGRMWMPGANEATTIEFSSDILLNGKDVKTGKYSIWTIPGEKKWTVILSSDWDQWHTKYPGEDLDTVRLEVESTKGSHMELLSFYFPLVTKNSASINLHWGKTIIPLEIGLKRAG